MTGTLSIWKTLAFSRSKNLFSKFNMNTATSDVWQLFTHDRIGFWPGNSLMCRSVTVLWLISKDDEGAGVAGMITWVATSNVNTENE